MVWNSVFLPLSHLEDVVTGVHSVRTTEPPEAGGAAPPCTPHPGVPSNVRLVVCVFFAVLWVESLVVVSATFLLFSQLWSREIIV